MRPPPHDPRAGFVLIAVLWLLVALGAVGIHASLELRTERLAAANVIDGARARAAATAGGEYARSRLSAAMLDRADELRAEAQDSRRRRNRTASVGRLFSRSEPLDDPWRAPEELVVPEMSFADARFSLQLRDVDAGLSLNAADEEMLQRFFAMGLELDAAQADRITQAILDWRDEDDLPRVGGGERDEYLRAGLPVLPANRFFIDVDELRHVMGVTPEIHEAAAPYLNLIGSGQINVNTAPEPVLMALPGMTRAAAREIVALRDTGTLPRSSEHLFGLISAGSATVLDAGGRRFEQRVSFTTNAVEIISDGWVEGSAVRARLRMIVSRSDQGALVLSREFRR